MQTLACTNILPYEAWEAILDKIISIEDVHNCYQVCKDWRNIILTNIGKPTLIHHRVIPILWKKKKCYVSSGDILTCRAVCQRWRSIVDTSELLPTPTSRWEICFEIMPKTRLQGYWGEDWPRHTLEMETSGPFQHASRALKERHFLSFVKPKVPGSHSLLVHGDGDPEFLDVLKSTSFDPCQSTSLDYRAVIKNGSLGTVGNQTQTDSSSAATIQYKHGRKSWTIMLSDDFADLPGTTVRVLSSLFHHFPSLKSLQLRLSLSSPDYHQKGLDELERKVVASVKDLEMTRLNNLTELVVDCEEFVIVSTTRYYNTCAAVPLPYIISTLIASSPRLQKVRVSLLSSSCRTTEDDDNRHLPTATHWQGISVLLSGISRAPALAKLELVNWKEELRLDQLSPRMIPQLQKLCVELRARDQLTNTAGRALHTFLGILHLLSASLQELQIAAPATRCNAFGSSRSMEGSFGRICKCNVAYSKCRNYTKVEEFRSGIFKSGKIRIFFEKLRILDIPHGLIHPAIFPGLMKACPTIAELRVCVDDREVRLWKNNNADILADLEDVALELWAEAPTTALRIIVFRNSGWSWSQRFSRRMFERKSLSSNQKRMGSLVWKSAVACILIVVLVVFVFFSLFSVIFNSARIVVL